MSRSFTNKYGLPKEIVNIVSYDDHVTKGDISVTTLIDPPRPRLLRKRFDYKEEVNDMALMMLGTAFHSLAEEGSHKYREYYQLKKTYKLLKKLKEDELAKQIATLVKNKFFDEVVDKDIFLERTLSLTLSFFNEVTQKEQEVTISGTQDHYIASERKLKDYKVTTWNNYKSGNHHWVEQQNIYAYMLRKHGFEVDSIDIIAYFRDYNKVKASGRFGKSEFGIEVIKTIPLTVWSDAECEEYIYKRVKIHFEAQEKDSIPHCTNDERWSEPDMYALMGTNTDRALKRFLTEAEALRFLKEEPKAKKLQNPYIEKRVKRGLKCDLFCAVKDICEQYKEMM